VNTRNKKLPVNLFSLKKQSLEISIEMGIECFKASNEYLWNFLRRNNLNKLITTHFLQKVGNEVYEEVYKFARSFKIGFADMRRKLNVTTTKDLSN